MQLKFSLSIYLFLPFLHYYLFLLLPIATLRMWFSLWSTKNIVGFRNKASPLSLNPLQRIICIFYYCVNISHFHHFFFISANIQQLPKMAFLGVAIYNHIIPFIYANISFLLFRFRYSPYQKTTFEDRIILQIMGLEMLVTGFAMKNQTTLNKAESSWKTKCIIHNNYIYLSLYSFSNPTKTMLQKWSLQEKYLQCYNSLCTITSYIVMN